MSAAIQRRPYQREALREFIESQLRVWAKLWERQSGKSTTFADMMLFEMIKHRNRSCVYGSASLLLGSEIPLKIGQRLDGARTIEKDAALFSQFAASAATDIARRGMVFQTADSSTDKIVTGLSEANFTELFESQKLEFRVYHDRTSYSRTKVIAPNIATARSWSGTVFLDEVAFIRNLRELLTALLPIISSNKSFKLIMATTPPEFDDTHYSFELLSPPAGLEFKPNANGNWYESEAGIKVHRADAFDTNLAGKIIYDLKNGAEITPEEAFRRAPNKDGHRIAHWLWWMLGGAAACDLLKLKNAQERGVINPCQNFLVDTDADMVAALNWLAAHVDPKAKIGIGYDVATTTKQKSNPSAVSVVEEHGPDAVVRARFVWKTKDPDIAIERLDNITDVIARRPGGRAKAMAQDASNERNYCVSVQKHFRGRIPVLPIVGSEIHPRAKLDKPSNCKEFLGDQLVAKLDDNNLTLPPDGYTKMDYRLVMKDRGKFVCEPNDQGMHGDTFDADKLGIEALQGKGGIVYAHATPVGSYQGGST